MDPTKSTDFHEQRKLTIFEHLKRGLVAFLPEENMRALSLLDYGSGRGDLTKHWAPLVAKAYGADLGDFGDFYHGTGVEYVKSDGQRVPLADGSIDVVVSHSVLEHVSDIVGALKDIDRLLKVGGRAYLTIAPLYYSATGIHRKAIISNWEHLDPSHPAYLASSPLKFDRTAEDAIQWGSYLNRLTVPEFLAAVGEVPWRIDDFQRSIMKRPIPDWVDLDRFGRLNVLTKGLSLVATKLAS